jgi:hypothetical protein
MEKNPLGGSEYWGCLEGREKGGEIGLGAFPLIRGFLVPLSNVYPVAYKEWPEFEYLNSNYGANLSGLRDERNIYGETQFTFSSFYRTGLIRVWYRNLRNPVKVTSLSHLRYTEARPQYKASNICKPEDWNKQVQSRKNKMLGSYLLANSRQPI